MGYNKIFMVLNRFDAELCEQGATGYCKIEAKNDETCIITLYAQGLRKDEGIEYSGYLLSYSDNKTVCAKLGRIEFEKDSGEIYIETDSKNVLSTQMPITKFNMVIICTTGRKDLEQVNFPLVGFYNIQKQDKWKVSFLKCLDEDIDVKAKQVEKESENKIDNSIKKDIEDLKAKKSNTDDFERIIDYINDIKKGNIKKLNGIMGSIKEIEECNPFANVKLKYKWWKVKSMKFFENIFKYSVISNQIFKHPLIKKMLRDSNHCLFGAVSDTDEKIRYIVYGFPSKYSLKDQVYVGGFANFYPCIGYTKTNGAFGYWVVHIKLDNNSIIMTV